MASNSMERDDNMAKLWQMLENFSKDVCELEELCKTTELQKHAEKLTLDLAMLKSMIQLLSEGFVIVNAPESDVDTGKTEAGSGSSWNPLPYIWNKLPSFGCTSNALPVDESYNRKENHDIEDLDREFSSHMKKLEEFRDKIPIAGHDKEKFNKLGEDMQDTFNGMKALVKTTSQAHHTSKKQKSSEKDKEKSGRGLRDFWKDKPKTSCVVNLKMSLDCDLHGADKQFLEMIRGELSAKNATLVIRRDQVNDNEGTTILVCPITSRLGSSVDSSMRMANWRIYRDDLPKTPSKPPHPASPLTQSHYTDTGPTSRCSNSFC